MLDQIMNATAINVLGRGLQAANLRHAVISDNIANVNTPNFKKSEVVFESLLAEQMTNDTKKLAMVRTRDKHLPIVKEQGLVSPQIQEDGTTSMRTDNNNVDIDIEMAELAKNNVYYNALSRQIGGNINDTKMVIRGQ